MKSFASVFIVLLLGLVVFAPMQSHAYFQYLWDPIFDGGHGQTGAWTPYLFPNLPDSTGTLAQSFNTATPFTGIRMHSPTWNGTGAGYRMTVYAWNTDYATTVAGTALAQKDIVDHPDNGSAQLDFGAPLPAGNYLLLTDNPVPSTTGNIGHWGWAASNLSGKPIPAAYSNGAVIEDASGVAAVFDIQIGAAIPAPYVLLENFYTENGSANPVSLASTPKVGQRFTATQTFDGVEVNGPTWGTNGYKGCTIKMWAWAGTYAATVAQTPLITSVLTKLNDNFWFPCVHGSQSFAPGVYFWEMSDPTNPTNPGDLAIGPWVPQESTYLDGEVFYNGVAQTSGFSWQTPYRTPGAQIAVQFTGWESEGNSLSQTFECFDNIQGVGFTSPSWNGTGAGYRMSLYSWKGDFGSTVAVAPIKQQTFSNYSDNATVQMVLDAPQPAGKYLIHTDMAVKGSGAAGHWAFKNCPDEIGTDAPRAFIDGYYSGDFVGYEQLVFFITYAVLPAGEIGPDARSRSVLRETAVNDWALY